MNAESAVNGGGAFKAGPIGNCQVCFNRKELGHYPDGRAVCEECWEALEFGRRRNIESGKIQVPADLDLESPAPVTPSIETQVPLSAWTSTDADERSRYLRIIQSAKREVIEGVIGKLVHSGVLHLDFHKIIQNERWFSIIDLRRIAEQVDPDALCTVQPEKVTAKQRRKKCSKTLSSRLSASMRLRTEPVAEGAAISLPHQHPEIQEAGQLEAEAQLQ